jgi:hypothetical protein
MFSHVSFYLHSDSFLYLKTHPAMRAKEMTTTTTMTQVLMITILWQQRMQPP